MSAHTDPVFYERFEFCRTDCGECQRLDAEAMKNMSDKEARIEGLRRALEALSAHPESIPPMPEERPLPDRAANQR